MLQWTRHGAPLSKALGVENGGGMRALLSFFKLIETMLLIAIKLVLVFCAAIIAFIAALTWKK